MKDRTIDPRDASKVIDALARTHFLTYVRIVFEIAHPGQKLELAPYLNLITADLEAVRGGETDQQIFTLAPRTLKSFIATICFATWMLGLDPRRQIMIASHNMDMAKRHLAGIRKILESDRYARIFPNFRIGEKNTETEVTTSLGGYVLAVSFDSAPTGRGSDLTIIDDPFRANDIYSRVARDACEAYHWNALVSRRNRLNSPMLLVMQRLCEDDLAGRLMAAGGWKVRSLPIIAMHDEAIPYSDLDGDHVFRRKAGEVLNPARMAVEDLEKYKALPKLWAAQYQQSPLAAGSRIVKKELLKYHATSPSKGFYVQSWDTASSTDDRACYSVGLTWLVQKDCVYLVDIFREKRTYDEIRVDAIRLAELYKPKYVLVEDASSGPVVAQAVKGLDIGADVRLIKVTEAKELRLERCLGMFTEAQVSIPQFGSAAKEFLEELLAYPLGAYDDQVDAMTLFLNWVRPRLNHDVEEKWFDFSKPYIARGPLEGTPPGSARIGGGYYKWGESPNLRPGSGGRGLKPPRHR